MVLVAAHTPAHIEDVRRLFEEYGRWLDYDLCLQSFDAELATLPGRYAPPTGRLYLGMYENEPAGCIGLRLKREGVGEVKRLWVRPQYRGSGLGRKLAERVVTDARAIGYHTLVLDTLPSMKEAAQLYLAMGFRYVPPPADGPVAHEQYMEMRL